jgi:hypothetical protein
MVPKRRAHRSGTVTTSHRTVIKEDNQCAEVSDSYAIISLTNISDMMPRWICSVM